MRSGLYEEGDKKIDDHINEGYFNRLKEGDGIMFSFKDYEDIVYKKNISTFGKKRGFHLVYYKNKVRPHGLRLHNEHLSDDDMKYNMAWRTHSVKFLKKDEVDAWELLGELQ